MSKKISWILRKGAERIAINVTDGWVKLTDILNSDLLDDMSDRTEARLMTIVKESNDQKLRYEIKETSDGVLLRALRKAERKKPDEPPAQVDKGDGFLKKTTELRGDAPAFVPKGEAALATPMSPTAAYGFPSLGYPGFFPYGYSWPYAHPSVPTPAAAAPPADSSSTRFQGRIKSFNAEKGYGFIESAEAFQQYGRDVFLHKALIGDLTVGATVSFTIEASKEGLPRARDVQGSGSGGKSSKGKDSKGKGKGKDGKEGSKGKGKGKEGKDSKDKDEKKQKGKGSKKDKSKDKTDKSEEKAEAEPGEVSTDATAAPTAPEATPAEPAPADAAEAQTS